jgi:hypothetical protein
MIEARGELVVPTAPARAFALLSDPARIPEWRPDILEVSPVAGSGVGARYDEVIAFMGRKTQTFEVIEHVPGRAFAVRAVAGLALRPTQRYRVEPAGEGQTRIQYEIELPVEGGFVLMWPMLALMIPGKWRGYAANLGSVLTARTAAA